VFLLLRLVIAIVINALALWIADALWDSVSINGFWAFFIGALVLGIANAVIKPILAILTLPLIIVTLGFFYLLINIAMVGLAEWIAPDFSIDGFWTYVGVVFIVWVVNLVGYAIVDRAPKAVNA
jgi:putative membrane protein